MGQLPRTDGIGCMERHSNISKAKGRGRGAPSFFCVKRFYVFEKFPRQKPLGVRGYSGDSLGVVAPPTIPLRCVTVE